MDSLSFETLNNANLINDGISILLGIALSSACGFRIFVPFLMISLIGALGIWTLPDGFEWLDTNQALILFAVASAVEVFAYAIPWLDNLLDVVATPLATFAGVLATATALSPEMNPLVQWTVAIIAGGGSASLIKGLTNTSRLTSTVTTGGSANFIVAMLELIAAAILSLLAITLPAIAGILVIGLLIFAVFKLGQLFLKKRNLDSASS